MKFSLKILLAAGMLLQSGGWLDSAPAHAENLAAKQIDNYVLRMMEEVKLPGVSIAVVNGGQTYIKGYGYADLQRKEAVTADTLFELGSNSKAFTATGLLMLAEQGKLSLEDPVTRYLPELQLKYQGTAASPTVGQFLYQTSGLGEDTVTMMEPADDDRALERTVRSFSSLPLRDEPGKQFLYSTGNYDVLGAVIEKTTGTSYESFMSSQVMQPLGLVNSYVGREAAAGRKELATGYKLGIFGNAGYQAPTYRGNIPAGYILSSGNDMARWLNIQLGLADVPSGLRQAVRLTHVGDESVAAVETPPYTSPFRYGGGWLVFSKTGGLISHGGNNPNFSSYIMVNPAEKIGIAVLGNRNSSYTYAICEGLYALIHGLQPADAPMDTPYYANLAAKVILGVCVLLGLWFIYKIVGIRRGIRAGIRMPQTRRGAVARTGIVMGALAAATGIAVWMLPKLLFWGYPWSFIGVWAPFTLLPSMLSIFVMVVLLAIYRVMARAYPLSPNGGISL